MYTVTYTWVSTLRPPPAQIGNIIADAEAELRIPLQLQPLNIDLCARDFLCDAPVHSLMFQNILLSETHEWTVRACGLVVTAVVSKAGESQFCALFHKG